MWKLTNVSLCVCCCYVSMFAAVKCDSGISIRISEPVSMTPLPGWRRSIWQGLTTVPHWNYTKRRFCMCDATLCCNKSKTRTLWWGAGSFKYLLHSCAFLFTVSLDFSWKSTCHKQASMQTNKQAGKPCMDTQAVLIRGQTWLNGHIAVSLQFFHLGNGANANLTLGCGSLVCFTVYKRRPHTAAPLKAKMSHAVNGCHIKQPGKCHVF